MERLLVAQRGTSGEILPFFGDDARRVAYEIDGGPIHAEATKSGR